MIKKLALALTIVAAVGASQNSFAVEAHANLPEGQVGSGGVPDDDADGPQSGFAVFDDVRSDSSATEDTPVNGVSDREVVSS